MATIAKQIKLILTDVGNNNNKFWYGEAFTDGTYHASWGRIGVGEQNQTKSLGSERSAITQLDKKASEKQRKGYRPLDIVEDGKESPALIVQQSKLKEIAKKQIKTASSIVRKLIEYFTQVNAHQITKATGGKVVYHADSGTFKTPLGIVTQTAIDKAQRTLTQIVSLVGTGDYGYNLERLTNDYFMAIPHNIGMGRLNVRSFWMGNKMQSEQDLVDSLQASLLSVQSQPIVQDDSNEAEEQVFNVSMELVNDQTIMDRIVRFFNASKNDRHTSSGLKVSKVYSVIIEHERKMFESKGKVIGNTKELWHGTRASNVLSILKQGLVIPAAGSAHCTGRMYGNGLYFSDQSTKSLNYSHGYWDGGAKDNNCFMFLADVAMGKEYIPSNGYGQRTLPAGFDSMFAKGGISGVSNNEMIVYKLHQVSLKYLVEFCK